MKHDRFASNDKLLDLADEPSVMVFPLGKGNRPAVVIAPGGGWHHVTVGLEGVTVAKWFNSIGIVAIVLKYRLPRPGLRYPAPMDDAREAIETVRRDAEALGVDPSKVGMMGFSVGGQIAGCLALQDQKSGKPDFAMLIYSVVSMREKSTFFCLDRLFDADVSKELLDATSLELLVTGDEPPIFMAHATDDALVSILGPMWFNQSMIRLHKKDDYMCVFYSKGEHGLRSGARYGLCGLPEKRDKTWPEWPDRCEEWLRKIGVLPIKSEKTT